MTGERRATEEQWSAMVYWASKGKDDGGSACLLELRDRVEALEAGLKRAFTDHILLANATSHQMENRDKFFADLLGTGRFQECLEIINNSKASPNLAQIRSSLVHRVACAIDPGLSPNPDLYADKARAVIREVAGELRAECFEQAAQWLEYQVEE